METGPIHSDVLDAELDRSLRVLEWPQVLARILACCQWSGGQEVLATYGPLPDLDDLKNRQAQIKEALILENEGAGRTMGGLTDPRPAIEAAQRARVLTPDQLQDVELLCTISRDVHTQFKGREQDLPLLSDLVATVIPHQRLQTKLRRSISRDGKVTDEASEALRRLRYEIREAESKLQRSLQSLLRHPELSKTYQEPIVTQRDGRFVIPVKAEYKGRFPGLVIDQSASGATLFMEPYIAVNQGNDLRQKQLAEEREIHRILVELSSLVADHATALNRATEALARLDAISGLARYALNINGILPNVTEDGELVLKRAHHPLIDEGSVPIDLELSSGVRTLVITGPNTGGKTVALKIAGLLTLMATSGFPVPAHEESSFPLVTRVWADIGDEQSLSQSLSTFSAHLVHILEILEGADDRSLILLDELGAGTDPSEGGALGLALLEEFHSRGARTVVTTHLSQLKVQAKKVDGFENAAVEFNTKTLRPTYRVLMGIPGRSNALSIAAQLGLPENLLHNARSYLGGGYQGVEELLDDLEMERDSARKLDFKLKKEREKARATRHKLQAERDELRELKEAEIERARQEAERIIEETKARTRRLLKEFQQGLKEVGKERKEALLEARRAAREWAQRMRGGEAELERFGSTALREDDLDFDDLGDRARGVARAAEAGLSETRSALPEKKKKKPKKKKPQETPQDDGTEFKDGPQKLAEGTRVYCPKLGQEGLVVSQKGQRVDVKLGQLKMTLNRDEIEVFARQNSPQPEPKSNPGYRPAGGVDTFELTLDLRGQRVDMALFEIDKYIDRACLAGVEKVEILHGKGTGVLRQAIQQNLKKNRQVTAFRDGEHGEGGWGVTVVNLRV